MLSMSAMHNNPLQIRIINHFAMGDAVILECSDSFDADSLTTDQDGNRRGAADARLCQDTAHRFRNRHPAAGAKHSFPDGKHLLARGDLGWLLLDGAELGQADNMLADFSMAVSLFFGLNIMTR